MKTQTTGKTVADVINSAAAKTLGMVVRQSVSPQAQEVQLGEVVKQMTRIFDTLNDRTNAVLRALGVELGQVRASWRPLDGIEGLAEKLAHVEIIPEVKANALTNDK